MISLGLRYFLEVARSARSPPPPAQHVAASAVSRQIAKLEDELGIALFERQARGMALSDAGRQLAATPAPPRWRPSASPPRSAIAASRAT